MGSKVSLLFVIHRSSRHLQGLYTEWEEEGGEDIEQVSYNY